MEGKNKEKIMYSKTLTSFVKTKSYTSYTYSRTSKSIFKAAKTIFVGLGLLSILALLTSCQCPTTTGPNSSPPQ